MPRISGTHQKWGEKAEFFSRGFSESMVLTTAWFLNSRLQNYERIDFCSFKLPNLFVTAALGNKTGGGLGGREGVLSSLGLLQLSPTWEFNTPFCIHSSVIPFEKYRSWSTYLPLPVGWMLFSRERFHSPTLLICQALEQSRF